MMRYNKIFYWSDEDQSYIVTVPSLPGCMSDGETIEESCKNADVVIREWIDFAEELGNDVPDEDPVAIQSSNPDVFDVVSYILNRCGPIMGPVKLQKLLYYCQAWCLGWYGRRLVEAGFEDWKGGPVCRDVYETHKGKVIINANEYPSSHVFTKSEMRIMDMILSVYHQENPMWLSEQTHREDPWRITRGELDREQRDTKIISDELMIRYYGQMT